MSFIRDLDAVSGLSTAAMWQGSQSQSINTILLFIRMPGAALVSPVVMQVERRPLKLNEQPCLRPSTVRHWLKVRPSRRRRACLRAIEPATLTLRAKFYVI